MYQISGAATGAPIFSASNVVAASATPNPPDVTGLVSADHLVISGFEADGAEADDDTWCTAAPTSFTGLVQKTTGTAGAATDNVMVAAAQQAFTGANVTITNFTMAQSLPYQWFNYAFVAAAGGAVHSRAAVLSGTAAIAASGAALVTWTRQVAIPATAAIAASGTAGTTQVQNLVATATSSSTITLSWDDVASLTGEVYDIERNGVVILSDYAGTHTVGSPYTDSGLTASTLYTYRVRAVL